MLKTNIYIYSSQARSGTLVVSIGFMEILKGHFEKVAYFRPIIDKDICENVEFMIEHFNLDMSYNQAIGFTKKKYIDAFSKNQKDIIIDEITSKIQTLYEEFDIVLIEGYSSSDFDILGVDINLLLASELSSHLVPVISAKDKSDNMLIQEFEITKNHIKEYSLSQPLATFITRIKDNITYFQNHPSVFFIPEDETLASLNIIDISKNSNINIINSPQKEINHIIKDIDIASMGIESFIHSLKESSLIITNGDRLDIILSALLLYQAKTYPYISAILICSKEIDKSIYRLIKSVNIPLVILHSQDSVIDTLNQIKSIKPSIHHNDRYKLSIIKSLFENSKIDSNDIIKALSKKTTDRLTPSIFRYRLIKESQSDKKRIVLPEAEDKRVLLATQQILQRGLAEIILLGEKEAIESRAKELHIDISKATIIEIAKSPFKDEFTQKLYELRKDKGLTYQQAQELIMLPNYFGVMMVESRLADGMVSGSISTTADTIRPALQIIGTKDDIDIVSSLFFMALSSGVVIYADCAINVKPTAKELASIAISTYNSAKAFNIEPKIAMLSYSSGNSGKGEEVERVKSAIEIVKKRCKDIAIDGPMQYDTATNIDVASKKMPNSPIAGRANIFIFPDLNSGNNTYKAVQRNTNTLAIGPILQGLRYPINDLSRGCSVDDIVNTIMVTAIMAQKD